LALIQAGFTPPVFLMPLLEAKGKTTWSIVFIPCF